MPTLRLMRPDEKLSQLAEVVVYLNGRPLGTIGNNEVLEFDIPEGRHRLKAKTDSQGSKAYQFTIAAAQTKSLVISTGKEANTPEPLVSGTVLDFFIIPLQLLYYFTLGHNRYLNISELKLR